MSDASIIQQMTLGTPLRFTTSAAIDRVKIHNDSSFYLRVYYGADAPTDANVNGWHDTVEPGDAPLLGVVGANSAVFANRSYVQSTPYSGVITILPFLPAGAASVQGLGGMLFGASLCYLTAYYEGEYANNGNQVEAFIQAAKQLRLQAVPIAGLPRIVQTTNATANDFVLEDQVFPVGSPVIAANKGAAANTVINIYWLGALTDMESTVAAGAAACEFSYDLYITDAGGVTRFGPLQMYRRKMVSDNGGKTFHMEHLNGILSIPVWFQTNVAPNTLQVTDRVKIKLHNYASVGTWSLWHNIYYIIDYNNQSLLPGIGGAPNPVAWSATNPQNF